MFRENLLVRSSSVKNPIYFAAAARNHASINYILFTKEIFNLPLIIRITDIKDCDFWLYLQHTSRIGKVKTQYLLEKLDEDGGFQ